MTIIIARKRNTISIIESASPHDDKDDDRYQRK